MFSYAYDLVDVLTVALEALIIFRLLRGPFRRFVVLLVYLSLDLLSTVAEIAADIVYKGSKITTAAHASTGQKLYVHLFWTDEVMLDLLLFLMVILLTYQATEGSPMRRGAGRLLAIVVVAVIGLPFLLYHPTFSPWPKAQWFINTSQLLNFGGAIMNLALWAALIASKRRDPRLLSVSAGLGLIVTGAAICFGLEHLIPAGPMRWLPNSELILTHIGGLIVWSWAFQAAPKNRPAVAARQV